MISRTTDMMGFLSRAQSTLLRGCVTAALLAGCAPSGTFDYEVTEAARQADWPSMYSGEARPTVPDATQDPSLPIDEAAAALKARATALRARAAQLQGPILSADDPAAEAFGG